MLCHLCSAAPYVVFRNVSEAARHLVDRLREMLSKAGFEIRQWASNVPSVLSHLPPEAQAESLELWLAQDKSDIPESTLGLKLELGD